MTLLPCPLQMTHLSSSGSGTQPIMPAGGQHQQMKNAKMHNFLSPEFFHTKAPQFSDAVQSGCQPAGVGSRKSTENQSCRAESKLDRESRGAKGFAGREEKIPLVPETSAAARWAQPRESMSTGRRDDRKISQPQAHSYRIIHSGFRTSCLSCSSTWRNAVSPEPDGANI